MGVEGKDASRQIAFPWRRRGIEDRACIHAEDATTRRGRGGSGAVLAEERKRGGQRKRHEGFGAVLRLNVGRVHFSENTTEMSLPASVHCFPLAVQPNASEIGLAAP